MYIFALLLLSLMAVPPSDPIAGNWSADLAGSTLPSGFPELQSQTMELRFASGKLQCSTERVDRRGTKTHAFFAAAFDGRRYPVSGMPDIFDRIHAKVFRLSGGGFLLGHKGRIQLPDSGGAERRNFDYHFD